jgi:hypothetical protein
VTAPTPVGTPDWIRTFATSRTILTRQIAASVSVNTTFPVFAFANMDTIGISFQGIINPGQLILQWFQDAAMTQSLVVDEIEVLQGQTFDQTIPVKGPFAALTISPQGGTPFIYTLIIWEAPSPAITQPFPNANVIMSSSATSVGAGATVTVRPVVVMAGPATFLAYSDNAAAWNTELLFERAGGATGLMIHLNQAVPIKVHATYLPTCPARIDLRNFDGAARNFIYALVAKPLYP